MPTTPFGPEHLALAASVRGLVEGPLTQLAAAGEEGANPYGAAMERCSRVGLFELSDDVLAATLAAQELGRVRSGGLVRVLVDTMLTAALGLRPLDDPVAVAAGAGVAVGQTASGSVPFVAGGATAGRLLLLDDGVLVELTQARVVALDQPHALRGAAPAAITLDGAPYQRVPVDPAAVARWELARAAAAVGAAWQTWDDACAYAQQRRAFGRPIARFQVNRHALARAATHLTAAEALVHDTAEDVRRGQLGATAPALLYATGTAVDVADRALQLHGGNGYTSAYDVSRSWRDASAGRVGVAHLRRRVASKGARP